MKRWSGSDLPLAKDASARFLPWLVAFMVFLAAIALLAAMTLERLATRWDSSLSGRVTVQIPPPPEGADESAEAHIARAVELLRGMEGVAAVEVMESEQAAALLEPWLGDLALMEELPLPRLLAVRLSGSTLPRGMAERLEEVVPGALLDDHQRWLGGVIALLRSLQAAALGVVLLVGGAAVLTVVYVTRTGLAIHRQVIELLHLMGAQDSYIAAQFQAHALRLGLLGGSLGLGLALLVLLAFSQLEILATFGSLELAPGLREWTVLLLLPLAAAAVAMLTARLTVLRTLARLA